MKIVLDGRPIQHSAARGLGRYTVNLINNLLAIDHNNSYELFYDPFAPTPGTFAGAPSRLGIKPPFFIGLVGQLEFIEQVFQGQVEQVVDSDQRIGGKGRRQMDLAGKMEQIIIQQR